MKTANVRNYFVRNIYIEASYDLPQNLTKHITLDPELRNLATMIGNEEVYLSVNKLFSTIKERGTYKLDSEVLALLRRLHLIFHNIKNALVKNTAQNNSRQYLMTNSFLEAEV